jgi:hypothetical protein
VKVSDGGKGAVPLPPSAVDLEKEMAGHIAPVSDGSVGGDVSRPGAGGGGDGTVHLIGTVGDRALLLKSNGETEIVPMGGDFEMNGKTAKVVLVGGHSMDIILEGKRKTLLLEASSALVAKAAQQAQADASIAKNGGSGSEGSLLGSSVSISGKK